jgi:hypothetical protein
MDYSEIERVNGGRGTLHGVCTLEKHLQVEVMSPESLFRNGVFALVALALGGMLYVASLRLEAAPVFSGLTADITNVGYPP